MKAVLLFLILLNALFFGWARWVAESPGQRDAATPEPDAQPLVLLAERYPERAAALAAERAASQAPVGEDRSEDGVEDRGAEAAVTAAVGSNGATPSRAGEPAGAAGEAPTAGELPDAPANADPARAGTGPSAAATTNEPDPQTPSVRAPASLPAEARRAVDELASSTRQVAAADPQPVRCISVGPFSKRPRANLASDALRGLGGEVSERTQRGRIWVGHWVHLPPAASRQAAVDVVEKLRGDGVSDIYIETSQPLRNAISLGLFSDVTRAETRAGKIRALGVRPQIRDRFREGDQIFLDARLPESAAFDASRFQLGPIALSSTPRDCP